MHVHCKRFVKLILTVLLAAGAKTAAAQAVVPFSIVGHIQTFTLAAPTGMFSAATMVVNGITVVIPANTVVVMPAAYLTPQQIFACSPYLAPPSPGAAPPPPITPAPICPPPLAASAAGRISGLALDDKVPGPGLPASTFDGAPLAAFEASLQGNIVGGVYIAGLVHISQQSLNNSAGFIRSINAMTGEMCVGPVETPIVACAPRNTRVRVNDPSKRYGAINTSPDQRFSVDPDNPTIHAQTGYPMCVPSAGDTNCPLANRPLSGGVPLKTFVMTGPTITVGLPPGHPPIVSCASALPACDPDKQAPFMVGDFINFAGTLFRDADPTHPFYISAHTIEANVGIYTRQGAGNTAYVFQEKLLLGTQGPLTGPAAPPAPPPCVATLECTAKIRVVGFITDPTRAPLVGIYAIDVNPATGVRTSRKLAVNRKLQAPFGRFRYEIAKASTLVPNGLGATREILVRIDDPAPLADGTVIPDTSNSPPNAIKANGLIAGQYFAPVGEYLFPEGLVMGAPPPKANFNCLAFLTAGWAIAPDPTAAPGTPPIPVPQLAPWPDVVAPPAVAASIRCDI